MSLRTPAADTGPGIPGPVEPAAGGGWSAALSGWPLTALLMLYPLWWALGMGTLIVFVLAVPMAIHLLRRRPILVPPGFGIWPRTRRGPCPTPCRAGRCRSRSTWPATSRPP
jgi:hypothetical protein